MSETMCRTIFEQRGIHVVHDAAAQEFIIFVEGQRAGFAHYIPLTDGSWDFDHTVVLPEYRGQGLSIPLIRCAVHSAMSMEHPIVATCSAVARFMEKNSVTSN